MKKKLIIGAAIIVALLLCAYLLLRKDTEINTFIESPIEITESIIPQINPVNTQLPTESDLSEETATPPPSVTQNPITDRFGVLEILGTSVNVADNIDEKTLDKQPGWMPTSALPGEDGMCVILGHRNNSHLRILEKVKVGDEIKFTYTDGSKVSYTVSEIKLYEKDSNYTLPIVEVNSMVLVTCYPFRYSGHAPGKAIVIAKMI